MDAVDQTQPHVESFFDEATSTFTHVVLDRGSGRAAVIDPVLDFDLASAQVGTANADRVLQWLRDHECALDWILETHVHADHLSAAAYLKQCTGARTAIGAGIRSIQATIAATFGDLDRDEAHFDQLWNDGDTFSIGALQATVLATPGHTCESTTYLIGRCAFVGDSLFMPERGTARCDFPGADARALYDSIQRLYGLSDDTHIYVCHDYPPDGTQPQSCATVRVHKARNVHITSDTTPEAFVSLRRARDAKLAFPRLLIPALQVNIRAGKLPAADAAGRINLKVPVNVFTGAPPNDVSRDIVQQ
jgi:glyoxylase-like metal-dependent hydrolase (beta-lactamase superfamily II)